MKENYCEQDKNLLGALPSSEVSFLSLLPCCSVRVLPCFCAAVLCCCSDIALQRYCAQCYFVGVLVQCSADMLWFWCLNVCVWVSKA